MSSTDVMTEHKRQSFSGRICDDLCEVVINWLPFEDKLRLKSVSKQFNRCAEEVLRRQQFLIIDNKSEDILNHCSCLKTLTSRRGRNGLSYEIDVHSLAYVLKRMPYITSVDIGCDSQILNGNEVVDTIADNCLRLQTLAFDMMSVDEEAMVRFAKKFGHTLRAIACDDSRVDLLPLMTACERLVTLRVAYFKVDRYLRPLVANNPTLTHVNIRCKDLTEDEYRLFFGQLARLPALQTLAIHFWELFFTQEMLQFMASGDGIRALADNCRQLKSFRFVLILSSSAVDENHWMRCFGHFSRLQRLDVELKGYVSRVLDMSCLQTCHRLAHLRLNCYRLTDATFADVGATVPNLETLVVESTDTITDETFVSISALQRLKSFTIKKFYRRLDSITDFGFISLIDSCPQLRTVTIEGQINITVLSFNAIIEKALKYPKTVFKYKLSIDESMKKEVIEAIATSAHPLTNLHIN